MNIPHPGQLDHRIRIGTTVSTVNENGYPEETDSVLCTVWAGIEDDSARYFFSGDSENTSRGLAFIIRWRDGIRPGMWVLWDGIRRQITQIGEFDFRHRYLRLITTATKGVN